MQVTLTASSAAKIVVWMEGDLYHARRFETPERPQVCLAVDLFEVIAELAELDLEQPEQAAEASSLATQVQAQLNHVAGGGSLPAADKDDAATRESAP
ncbi:MAG TPA: hypothetical protein VG410_08980 [Solirubrobacteraceae bacterium]|jgi:hypothetical protein|nr:hypothetical protein [Solirubrobacteraceae bacterium]